MTKSLILWGVGVGGVGVWVGASPENAVHFHGVWGLGMWGRFKL